MPLVLFLRGVNVGGHKAFKPSALANVLRSDHGEECGFHPDKRASSANLRPPATGSAHNVPLADTSPAAFLSTQRSSARPAYFHSIARLGVEIARALDYAHEQGVVHRDIKPSNLLIDRAGKPWITDFGLAHVQGDHTLTVSGDLLGTLRYMSPEQASGRRGVVDHRTDIYSLGITLYELLALRPAFAGDDRQTLLRQIEQLDPPSLRSVDGAIPRDLESIIQKAVAKRRDDRYESALELAEDLERFLHNQPVQARRPSRLNRVWRWVCRNPMLAVSLTIVLAFVLTLGIAGPLVAIRYASLATREATARHRADSARQLGLIQTAASCSSCSASC